MAEAPRIVLAGGTDLYPATTAQALAGPVLDLGGIVGLRGISQDQHGWRIGAMTTWTDILRADLPPAFDGLRAAAREVGSVQIQNSGTLAGNLCNASPAADGVPCLLTLDATVELSSSAGVRHVPLAAFITGPRCTQLQSGELVTAVHVPAAAGAGQSAFLKLGARRYLVISIAMVACRLEVEEGWVTDAAVAVGSCSAVATRLSAVEQAIVSGGLVAVDPAMIIDALAPIDDVRGTADYRAESAAILVRRCLELALKGPQ